MGWNRFKCHYINQLNIDRLEKRASFNEATQQNTAQDTAHICQSEIFCNFSKQTEEMEILLALQPKAMTFCHEGFRLCKFVCYFSIITPLFLSPTPASTFTVHQRTILDILQ